MQRLRYLIGFLPWLVFGAFDAAHVREGTLAALGAAALVTAGSLRRSGPKVVEIASLGAFTILGLVGLLAGSSGAAFLTHYARAVPTGALAVATFATLRGTPLIEQYARAAVAAEVAGTAAFRARMRQFTVLWGAVFATMAGSHVVAGVVGAPHANRLFNWAIPIGLVMLGVRYMRSRSSASNAPNQEIRALA